MFDRFYHGKAVWLAAALLVVAILFSGLGRLPFVDRDEGEYATVALEMIERADYVIPHVNGRAYYEKPALYFWMMVLSFKTFGLNEIAGRLPSALAGLALIALTGWFALARGGRRLSLLTVLMSATSLLPVMMARVALVDMVLTLWTTLALILFYQGYRSDNHRDRLFFYGGWVALGLAFLTKGPVGVVVPLVVLIPLSLLNRDFLSTLRRIELPAGILVFLLVAGPWYVLAFLRDGHLFWEGFFISQNVRRYTEVLLGHGPPVWYFLPVLAVGLWPWFFFGLARAFRGLFKNQRTERQNNASASLDFFLGLWLAGGLVFFSLGATKLPHYILPVAPAVILLAARWWDGQLETGAAGPREKIFIFSLIGLVGLALASLLLVAGQVLGPVLDRARAGINPDSAEYAFQAQPPDLGWGTMMVGLLLLLCLLAGLVFARKKSYTRCLAVLGLAGGLLVMGLTHVTAPTVFDYLQTPAKILAGQVRETLGPSSRLAAFGLYKPTMWFYTRRHILRIKSDRVDELSLFLNSDERVFLLSRVSLMNILSTQTRFRVISIKGGYLFGDNQGSASGTDGEVSP